MKYTFYKVGLLVARMDEIIRECRTGSELGLLRLIDGQAEDRVVYVDVDYCTTSNLAGWVASHLLFGQ